MLTLMGVVHAFAKAYPTPAHHPNGGGNTWDQWCGAAMWRLCEEYGVIPTGDVHSAYTVYTRSRIVSTDWRMAEPGDFHYWDIAGPGNGHVGIDVLGGGGTVFMATRSAKSIEGATALGLLSVRGYTLAKFGRARYLGFSRSYANGDVSQFVIPTSAPAAVSTTPVLTESQRKNMAKGVSTKNHGTEYFGMLVDGRWATVPSKATADALSVDIGKFTVLPLADFYALRDANQSSVPTDIGALAKQFAASFKAAL